MANETMQETLKRLLEDLRSDEAGLQLAAIRELGSINFSSEAIFLRLEKLALGEGAEVRAAALNALNLTTSQFVASKFASPAKPLRQEILKEISAWQSGGLIEPHRAEVLRRRYDFDLQPGKAIQAAPAVAAEEIVPEIPAPAKPIPASKLVPPAAPRPSLTQVILSETSIKIYLYLGAFFVIAAAAILAALVAAARLPVLLAATIAFAAGAVGLKKRLPQPSFALAVVFSFLLPIDANVIADSLNLSAQSNEAYWATIFLFMAIIWGLGTWFYASRLFSVVAFFSLSLGVLRFGEIFDAPTDWNIFSIAAANLLGLFGAQILKNWKDGKFAQPLFLLAQLQQGILLFVSLLSLLVGEQNGAGDWIAVTLTWLLAASFYAASDFLVPFALFPWTAAASLFLVPWLILSAFDASAPAQIAGFAVWGALAALASEIVQRSGRAATAKYHFPLLALSLPLFFVSAVWGLVEKIQYGFATLIFAAIVYTLVHALRPRWYVWMTALLAGLGAYFTFFALPFMETADVYFGYQLLGASLLLLIPELFFKEPLSPSRAWNWPPVALGTLLVVFNLFIALLIPVADESQFGNTAIILIVYAFLFTGYSLRFKKPVIGYLAAASAALAIVYALQHFARDWWLPALTVLAVIYYAAGYFLARREGTKTWGAMPVNSGLALGALVSLAAIFTVEPSGGWHTLAVVTLYLIEMFTRRNGYLELFAEGLLSIALILLLNDFKIKEPSYYLFGLSLLWLSCDAVFKIGFANRKVDAVTKVIGALLSMAAVLSIYFDLIPSAAALCLAVYTIFFAVYAWLYKNPLIGYASTSSLTLAIFFGLRAANQEQWLLPLTALAVIYYAAGYFLRRADKAKGWDKMLLFSGLGLGTLAALAAPGQSGGLEKAIPIAVAATLYAAEAFARRNVWLGFPANALYLMAYFVILNELKVDEPQFFSVGAAALGLLMHYLLTRAGNKTTAFITGLVSQLVLLGTTYIQMVSTGESKYFYMLFFQSLVVLVYGIVVRSRSLVIAPIGFVVLAVVTVVYNKSRGLSPVLIIGGTGIVLLLLGTLGVIMRERITALVERFSDWEA